MTASKGYASRITHTSLTPFGGLLGEDLAAKLVGASEHKRGDGGEEEGARVHVYPRCESLRSQTSGGITAKKQNKKAVTSQSCVCPPHT